MKRFWIAMVSLPSIWLAGFFIFVYGIPKKPADIHTKTDAIVVWTGGPCRITTGVELLHDGLSDKLFVSGVEKKKPKLIGKKCGSSLTPESVEGLKERIFLGYTALSTMGNAIETAEWVDANKIKSVRLVTTPYHMPRSLVEFNRLMPDVTVIPHPVSVKKFDHRLWYLNWTNFSKVVLEYSKYLVVRVGIRPWWRENILDD